MATYKKATRKTTSRKSTRPQPTPDSFAKTLGESAQQIWLAGVGALGRAQVEGTRLFETLAKEGATLEGHARRFAGDRAEVVREAVEDSVSQARSRATDTWGRLEKVFEDRIQRTLVKLDMPVRDDLADLSRKVDTLTAELRRRKAGASAENTRAAPTTRPATGKKSAKKAAPPKTAARRAPRKPTVG